MGVVVFTVLGDKSGHHVGLSWFHYAIFFDSYCCLLSQFFENSQNLGGFLYVPPTVSEARRSRDLILIDSSTAQRGDFVVY